MEYDFVICGIKQKNRQAESIDFAWGQGYDVNAFVLVILPLSLTGMLLPQTSLLLSLTGALIPLTERT